MFVIPGRRAAASPESIVNGSVDSGLAGFARVPE